MASNTNITLNETQSIRNLTSTLKVRQESTEAWTIIGVIGIITNLVLFLSIISSKSLRNPSHIIIASSFLVGVLFNGLYILPRWAAFQYFYQYPIICTILPLLGAAFLFNYNLHQCFISMDRYFAVKWPVKYRRSMHKRLYVNIMVILWGFSLLTAFIPVMTFRPFNSKRCVLHSGNSLAERINAYWQFFGWFFFPFITIIFCYSQIFHMIFGKRRKAIVPNVTASYRPMQLDTKKTINASIQMGILAFIFIVMMLPYTCVFLVSEIRRVAPVSLQTFLDMVFITRYLAFSYPAINPILYGYFVDSIRYAAFDRLNLKQCQKLDIPKTSQVNST